MPSCVDLERFKFAKTEFAEQNGGAMKFVYIGSVGARYTLDDFRRVISTVNRAENNLVFFQVYS